jgi:hypothetical protein
MVGFVLMVLFYPALLIPIPLAWQIVWAVGVITVAWYVDAITVRLVQAGRWRGILGYDT